jgi:4-oxalocrotonate tautomerase family enzyme
MPYVQCTIQSGLSVEKKKKLALEVAKALNETLGSPMEYIHVGISEIPSTQFVESGQIDLKYSDNKRDTSGSS